MRTGSLTVFFLLISCTPGLGIAHSRYSMSVNKKAVSNQEALFKVLHVVCFVF